MPSHKIERLADDLNSGRESLATYTTVEKPFNEREADRAKKEKKAAFDFRKKNLLEQSRIKSTNKKNDENATHATEEHARVLRVGMVEDSRRRKREEEDTTRRLRKTKVEAAKKIKVETAQMERAETKERYAKETKFTNDKRTSEKSARAAELARKKEEVLERKRVKAEQKKAEAEERRLAIEARAEDLRLEEARRETVREAKRKEIKDRARCIRDEKIVKERLRIEKRREEKKYRAEDITNENRVNTENEAKSKIKGRVWKRGIDLMPEGKGLMDL